MGRNSFRILIFLLCLGYLIQVGTVFARKHEIRFDHLTIEDGLSQSVVYCILQDRQGFMWFGTQGGLNKYDGKSFRIFRHNPFDTSTLSDDWILSLFEDSNGMLWVGTHGKGLNRLDPETGRVERFTLNPDKRWVEQQVWSILGDSHNRIWVGTDRGLYRLDLNEGQSRGEVPITAFFHDPTDPTSLAHDEVDAIVEDRAGTLWIGTFGGGLNKFNEENESFVRFIHDPRDPTSLSHNRVKVMVLGKGGILWIGTRGGGLNRFDPLTETFTHYRSDPSNPATIGEDNVLALVVDKEEDLWIGTKVGGLSRLDPATNQITRLPNDPTNSMSLNSIWVGCLYQDRTGVMWVGTGEGLSKFSLENQKFYLYRKRPGDPNSLSHNKVMGIFVDMENNLWVGTQHGLNKIDRATDRYTHYFHEPGNPKSIRSNIVRVIFQDHKSDLWIGTDDGLSRFNRRESDFRSFALTPSGERENISSIHQDRTGHYWFGTWGIGLYRASLKEDDTLSVVSFRPDPENEAGLNHNLVTCLTEDRGGNLWIGTMGGGLNLLDGDPEKWGSGVFKHFKNDPENRLSLSSNQLFCIHAPQALENEHLLWIGTSGGGLNKFNKKTGEAIHYLANPKGLPSNVVFSILDDHRGLLWLATQSGISKFDPEQEVFRNYDVTDGLQSNEFQQSFFKSARGELFFGGSHGLNGFFPLEVRDNPHEPRVFITRFQVFNEDLQLDKDISIVESLELSYKDYAIAVEFAALDYTVPEKNRYQYKLEGLNEEWIEMGTRNYVPFFNLPPRDYVLRVRASNNDGRWSSQEARLKLTISPPFYRTWWAYFLYSLAVAGVVYRYIRAQQKKLAQERFYARKLQQANQQLQLADKIKDEFLANTSHELRTPLNGMIGIADSLIDGVAGPTTPDQRENLSMIVSSGMRLSNLVNDILDFSKLRRSNIELNRRPVFIHSLTQVVLGLSKPLIRGKNLKLINDIDSDSPPIFGDESRLEQVMHNLVGNAIKFTESGQIRVTAHVEDKVFVVSVSDTGVGIPPEKVNRIFESFEQADGTINRVYGGTGLGLAITRKLVELHGGTLEAQSEVNMGSTFKFSIPLARETPDKHPLPPAFDPKEYEAIFRLSEDLSENFLSSDTPNADFRILMVDDEPINLKVLHNFLSACNYSITQATNGTEAIRLIEQAEHPFDLVLLDVMMPKMSGYEVCKYVRETYHSHELPIIMLTAKNQAGDVVTGFEAGANDYVVKPISKNELLVRIRTHLDLLKASRSLKSSKEQLEDYSKTLEQKVEHRTRELKQRNQELEALDDIVKTINHEVELGSVLNTLLLEAMNLFERTEKGCFLVMDHEEACFRVAASSGYTSSFELRIFTPDELARKLATAESPGPRVIHWSDSPAQPSFLGDLPSPCCSMVLPVTVQDKEEGYLLMNNFTDPEAFDQSDLARLKRLETHAETAIAKARILGEVRCKNEELVVAQTQLILQEKMVYLGNLIAGIAHEIQNPLNFVNNFSAVAIELADELHELLEQEKTAMDQSTYGEVVALLGDLKENSGLIHEHGKRVTRIVHNMMMHSQTGTRERHAVIINDLVDQQYELAYHGLAARGDTLGLVVRKDFEPQINSLHIVPQDIGRAILNILKNAFDTLAEKKELFGDSFTPRIHLTTRLSDKEILIIIRDNGQGIPEADRQKVFTPFFTTKPTGNGVGLGLSICFDIIVQGHQGSISVTSEQGSFSEFTIVLPKDQHSAR